MKEEHPHQSSGVHTRSSLLGTLCNLGRLSAVPPTSGSSTTTYVSYFKQTIEFALRLQRDTTEHVLVCTYFLCTLPWFVIVHIYRSRSASTIGDLNRPLTEIGLPFKRTNAESARDRVIITVRSTGAGATFVRGCAGVGEC